MNEENSSPLFQLWLDQFKDTPVVYTDFYWVYYECYADLSDNQL